MVKITRNSILIDALSSIIEFMRYMMLKVKTYRKITENALRAYREIVDLLRSGKLEKTNDVRLNRIGLMRFFSG